MNSAVEFHDVDGGGLLCRVRGTSIVPPVKSFVSIRKKTWRVKAVCYAVDDASDPPLTRIRAIVDLKAAR